MEKNEPLYEKYEKYEEALFDLLMDQVSVEEGKKLLEENERLQNDPAAAIPEEVYQRGLETIRREFAERRRKPRKEMARKAFLKFSAVVTILVLITTVAFAAFPELRARVVNTFVGVHDTYTDFSFDEDDLTLDAYKLNVGWMPDEFVLEEKSSDPEEARAVYRNESNAYIFLSKSSPRYYSMDSENSNIESISIQDFDGTLITNENQICVFWINTDDNAICKVFAKDVSTDIVIKVAQNFS